MVIQVGLIGTGYAAQKRAESLASDPRGQLVAVAGRVPQRVETFAQSHGADAVNDWSAILANQAIDLIIIATSNALHGPIVEAALNANKQVVVEYPLSLNLHQAEALVQLAKTKQRLLHVEHIERLGGLHRTTQAHLPHIGRPRYVNYRTINPKHPAPQKWSYDLSQAGFPFISALSRVHRLINLLGPVSQVFCQSRFEIDSEESYYSSCLCSAQLIFQNGTIAEITYGKGDQFWTYSRRMEIQGTQGSLIFDRDQGTLTTEKGTIALEVPPRKGLFAQDTQQVLDFLTTGQPLYIKPEESLYALKVADALRRSSESGQPVRIV